MQESTRCIANWPRGEATQILRVRLGDTRLNIAEYCRAGRVDLVFVSARPESGQEESIIQLDKAIPADTQEFR